MNYFLYSNVTRSIYHLFYLQLACYIKREHCLLLFLFTLYNLTCATCNDHVCYGWWINYFSFYIYFRIKCQPLVLLPFRCFSYAVLRPFQSYFSYIVTVKFIGGENQSTRKYPPTCRH